jgi:hypothetical protein
MWMQELGSLAKGAPGDNDTRTAREGGFPVRGQIGSGGLPPAECSVHSGGFGGLFCLVPGDTSFTRYTKIKV